MKSLQRCFWLVAWCVWAWLGFGLYRELPRELGPVARQLTLPEHSRDFGFLPDGHDVAATEGPTTPYTVRIHDAETGAIKGTLKELLPVDLFKYPTPVFAREDVRNFGVMLTKSDGGGFNVVDLRRVEQRLVGGFHEAPVRLHPMRPWVIVSSNQSGPSGCRDRIAVYDWQKGVRLFSRGAFEDQHFRCGEACFVGDTDDLVVTSHTGRFEERGGTYERYALGGVTPILKESFKIPRLGADPSASPNGLVVFTDLADDSVDVVDARAGKIVLSDVPREQRRSRGPGSYPIVPPAFFDRSGKTVVGNRFPGVWNLETGKLLWRGVGERWVRGGPAGDRFGVFEDWGKLIGKPDRFVTVAWRDVETGLVLFRCWAQDYRPWEWTSADGTLAVNANGLVHALPYRVHWPLFALCQTILASPIILLWTTLRWRRRRAARRQPAMAPNVSVPS